MEAVLVLLMPVVLLCLGLSLTRDGRLNSDAVLRSLSRSSWRTLKWLWRDGCVGLPSGTGGKSGVQSNDTEIETHLPEAGHPRLGGGSGPVKYALGPTIRQSRHQRVLLSGPGGVSGDVAGQLSALSG
jgi:hypothetical protein